MIIKPKTLEELKEEFVTALRDTVGSKLATILPDTVVDGIGWGIAKIAQRIITDIALLETKFFDEYAVGDYLDAHGVRTGLAERRGPVKDSVVLCIEGSKNEYYPKGTRVKSVKGNVYETTQGVYIDKKFAYVEATSQKYGAPVNSGELNVMLDPAPFGHVSIRNLCVSIGGYPEEHDTLFRYRIQRAKNIVSMGTAAFYEAVILALNAHVIRVSCKTLDEFNSKYVINVLKDDGSYFTEEELNEIKKTILPFFPLSDRDGKNITVKNFKYVYLSFRIAALFEVEDITTLQDSLNRKFNEYLDYRFWPEGQKVQWEDLISLCRETEGIMEVYQNQFSPPNDVLLGVDQIPKVGMVILQYADSDVMTPVVDITELKLYHVIVERGDILSPGEIEELTSGFTNGFDNGFE